MTFLTCDSVVAGRRSLRAISPMHFCDGSDYSTIQCAFLGSTYSQHASIVQRHQYAFTSPYGCVTCHD
jgi:hypothetical protein